MNEFSVIVSIYHKENPEWFREALDSVFAETVLPNEVVLVEDGDLTPELYAVIDHYANIYPIFKIIRNEKNLGLGLSMRKAVEAASNEILARMDTDDIIPPNRFERQLDAINRGYDVVSCWSQLCDATMKQNIAIKKRPENHNDIVRLAHRRSPVCHAACMMRKSAVLRAGNYQHCELYEDYHLWARMIMTGAKFYNVQEVLYFVRTTQDQMKRRSGLKYLKTELSFFKTFYHMGFFTINDFIINSGVRIVARLAPVTLRKYILTNIWKH